MTLNLFFLPLAGWRSMLLHNWCKIVRWSYLRACWDCKFGYSWPATIGWWCPTFLLPRFVGITYYLLLNIRLISLPCLIMRGLYGGWSLWVVSPVHIVSSILRVQAYRGGHPDCPCLQYIILKLWKITVGYVTMKCTW